MKRHTLISALLAALATALFFAGPSIAQAIVRSAAATVFVGSGSTTGAVDLATAEVAGVLPVSKGGGPVVVALNADAAANSTVTGVEITGLNTTLTAGTYHFKYSILFTTAAVTTGADFGVNYTGTATVLTATLSFQGTTLIVQNAGVTTAIAYSGDYTLAETTTAPDLNVIDGTANGTNISHAVIEGTVTVSDGGDLELWQASEVAASATTVKAGTTLFLTKLY